MSPQLSRVLQLVSARTRVSLKFAQAVRTSLHMKSIEKPQKAYGQKVRSIILLIMFGLYPVRTPGWVTQRPYFWNSHSPLSRGHTCLAKGLGSPSARESIKAGKQNYDLQADLTRYFQSIAVISATICNGNPLTPRATRLPVSTSFHASSGSRQASEFWATERCNGSGTHDCKPPKPLCTPHSCGILGWPQGSHESPPSAIFGSWHCKNLQKIEFTGPHLTLDAQVHDVVSTNGTIVHDDIPCPQGHCTPFPQSKGCLGRYCTQSKTTNRRRLIQGFTSLYHPFVVCGFRFLGLYHKT